MKGDSGSLVVGTKDCLAYGHVIASSGTRLYILPLKHTVKEIQNQAQPGFSILLPSPFERLAEAAKHHTLSGQEHTAMSFATMATLREVLLNSSKNPTMVMLLEWLLETSGRT